MRRLSGFLLAALLVGCGDARKTFDASGSVAGRAERRMEKDGGRGKDKDGAPRKDKAPRAGDERKPAADKAVQEPPQARKIIYTGQVELVVEDFDDSVKTLMETLAAHDGYVARSEITGRPGERRLGNWTLRIPVARFEDFRTSLTKLGELRRSTLDSEDITDRYFDMEAETRNFEAREKALRKLYDEKIAGSKLSDLLDVDRELSSVRGQINLRKGQLQRWDKETAFATLFVQMQDRISYVPPTSPAFDTQIGRTFKGSAQALLETGKILVLAVVALAPWLGIVLLAVVPVALLVRRARTRRFAPPPVPDAAPRDDAGSATNADAP